MRVQSVIVLVGAVAAALVLVGVGAFMGSTILVLAGMVGVPLLLVGAAAVQYSNLSQRAGGLTEAKGRHFQKTCVSWSEELSVAIAEARRIGAEEALVDDLITRASELVEDHADLRTAGDDVDIEPIDEDDPGGSWIHQTERSLREVLQEKGEELRPELENRLESAHNALGDEGDLEDETSLPKGTIQRVISAFETRLDQLAPRFEGKTDEVDGLIRDAKADGLEVSDAKERLRSARDRWHHGRPDQAVQDLEQAEALAYDATRPDFQARRDELTSALERLESLHLRGIVEPSMLDRISRLQREATGVDLEDDGLPGVVNLEAAMEDLLGEISTAVREEAEDTLATIQKYPPMTRRGGLEDLEETPNKLPSSGSEAWGEFESWIQLMTDFVPILQNRREDAALIPQMPRLEDLIKDHLDKAGEVSPSDLPLRDGAEDVLALYAEAHPEDVTYHDRTLRRTGGSSIE